MYCFIRGSRFFTDRSYRGLIMIFLFITLFFIFVRVNASDLSDGTYDIVIQSDDPALNARDAVLTVIDGKTSIEVGPEKETETVSVAEVGSHVAQPMYTDLADGEYSIELTMAGGSGKASIVSPTVLIVEEGKAYAQIQWSSPNYDYMIVDGEKYLNESEEGVNSTYHIPITCMDDSMQVIADTTAMGTPHEVNYTLTFFAESIGSKSALPQEAAKRVLAIAMVIIVGGGILNHYVNKVNRG